MDSDEAFHARTLFYQGSYSSCHSTVTSLSSPSPQLIFYACRSLIALNKPQDALALLSSSTTSTTTPPEASSAYKAVQLLAEWTQQPDSVRSDKVSEFSEKAETLADDIQDEEGDGLDSILRVTLATLLLLCDASTLAIFLLKQGCQLKSLESVALLIHIYLSSDIKRPDLARQVYAQAKTWADDAMLLQICEAWIGLVTGATSHGKESGGYQGAFYCFDEIAQLPGGSTSVVALNGKAVAQAAMGHWDEAKGNINEAAQIAPEDHITVANQSTIASHFSGPETCSIADKLRSLNKNNPLLKALEKQSALFDEAASKFRVSIS